MDIDTLRRATEALSLMEQTQTLLDRERDEVEKVTRRIGILEGRLAGCKQTLMECGVAVPVHHVTRHEALRTLESEGQKWDEEASLRRAADKFNHMHWSQRLQMENAAALVAPHTPPEHHGC